MLDQYADRSALITGASSGIGAEFARRLACVDMHLVIVARRTERLYDLAAELYARHHTRCEIVASDYPIHARRVPWPSTWPSGGSPWSC